MITIDFETRSTCDLKKAGGYKYSLDSTTQALCMAFKWPDDDESYLWHPAFPHLGIEECELSGEDPEIVKAALDALFADIEAGAEVEAHNSFFERCIWTNIMHKRFGWPLVNPKQWRCSASRAAMCAIPRDLDGATRALGLAVDKQKSADGKKLMLKMCKPRKPTKLQKQELVMQYGPFEEDWPILWHEDREMLQGLFDYCKQDVIAEEALSNTLPPLPPEELELWLIDQEINWRGVYFDAQMVNQALEIIAEQTQILNDELYRVSEGNLKAGTQRQALLKYVNANSTLDLPDTKGKTIKRALKNEEAMATVPDNIKRVLELCVDINRSSTAKYKGMRDKLVPDQRVRDMLMYHGAGTGRWTGKGIQPHNFPRGSLKPKASFAAAEIIRTGDRELLEIMWEPKLSVMEVLSSALRGAIMAEPGKELIVADYSSIEARVLIWLVNDTKGLDVFFSGKDIYIDMACSIYHKQYHEIDKEGEERRMGKQAILGLGYQMGWSKFQFTLFDSYDTVISDELAQTVVDAYRIRYAKVKAFWSHIEKCAIRAVKNKGKVVRCGEKLLFKFSNGFLRCKLPSGRVLYYRDPKVKKKTLPWGGTTDALTYMSVDGMTKKWVRTDTYGGKLTENVVQAIARDFMGFAIRGIHKHGKYDVIASVHDELLAEAPEGQGDYKEFEELMATLPAWGKGCPVAAEGWQGIRYRK